MFEPITRYVYELSKLEKFYGMIPLDIYISLVYFNYNEDEHKDVLLSLGELSHFMTGCLVEALTREKIDFEEINVTAKDFYISAIPNDTKEPKKALVFKYQKRKFLISELKFQENNGSVVAALKMRNMNKEELLAYMLSIHQLSLSLIDDVIKKCNKCKKLSVVGVDEKEEEVNEVPDNKFDLKNYESV